MKLKSLLTENLIVFIFPIGLTVGIMPYFTAAMVVWVVFAELPATFVAPVSAAGASHVEAAGDTIRGNRTKRALVQ